MQQRRSNIFGKVMLKVWKQNSVNPTSSTLFLHPGIETFEPNLANVSIGCWLDRTHSTPPAHVRPGDAFLRGNVEKGR